MYHFGRLFKGVRDMLELLSESGKHGIRKDALNRGKDAVAELSQPRVHGSGDKAQ
jgi:hypothetical protein